MIEDKTPSKINLEINKTDSTPEKDYVIYEPILQKMARITSSSHLGKAQMSVQYLRIMSPNKGKS